MRDELRVLHGQLPRLRWWGHVRRKGGGRVQHRRLRRDRSCVRVRVERDGVRVRGAIVVPLRGSKVRDDEMLHRVALRARVHVRR